MYLCKSTTADLVTLVCFVCLKIFFSGQMSTAKLVNILSGSASCWKSTSGRDDLKRIDDSKYLIETNLVHVTTQQAFELCKKHELEVGKVQSRHEFNILYTYLKKGTEYRVFLGRLENAKEDKYGNLEFQSFNLRDGQYYHPLSDCVYISCLNTFETGFRCEYKVFKCKDESFPVTVIPLCQFPKGSSCYKSLKEEEKHKSVDDQLISLGWHNEYNYYGSPVQKTWTEALNHCKKEGLRLYDGGIPIDQKARSRPETSGIDTFIQKTGLRDYTHEGRTWSSAYLIESGFVVFATDPSENLWDPAYISKNSLKYRVNNSENCFVVTSSDNYPGYYNQYSSRPIFCNVVNYYLCYEYAGVLAASSEEQHTTSEWYW